MTGDFVGNLDATLIEESIQSAALCADCIGRITGVPSSRLNDALPRLIGALKVGSILAACGVCLRQRIVHRRVGSRDTSRDAAAGTVELDEVGGP